jgi:anthranilate synthase component 2
MIILIDNYDSFTYNLVQETGLFEPDIRVFRNDAITVEEIESMQPQGIILSPGPGRPEESGICFEVIQKLGSKIPILGVCLGHQGICTVYGATVGHADHLMHGRASACQMDTDSRLFAGLPQTSKVGRYHSLAVKEDTLPETLKVTARSDDGEVMAVEHIEYPVYGVQFHPESILSEKGRDILKNFVTIANTYSK